MPEITIPRTGAHIRNLFDIVASHPDGVQAAIALKELSQKTELTSYEQGSYASTGGRRFEKIVRFATVDCVKAGWLLKSKGIWSVTDAGRQAMVDYPNPETFYREAIRLYRAWKESEAPSQIAGSLEELSPAETATADARITYEQAEEQAWNEIETHIRTMVPFDFQDLVATY